MMEKEKISLLQRFIIWRENKIKEKQFILILSFLVGIFTAIAALLLKFFIHTIQNFLTDNFNTTEANYLYLVYPVVGIFLAGWFVRNIVKDDISHGVTKILYAISRRQGRIKRHNIWSSTIASAITIGFGGSVGAEAPIVLTGSAIGSNLGSMFKMEHRTLMLLVGCGAAGALGGIFKAPIAGLVFTLEVLNGVIGADFADKVTMADLDSKQRIALGLHPEVQEELTQRQQQEQEILSPLENQLRQEMPYGAAASVDGRDISVLDERKGWYREERHGREVEVGEIAVHPSPIEGKYKMTAVIDGQVISHEISQKDYDKFLAVDDYHRMKIFSKIFSEVDMKMRPEAQRGLGVKIFAALAAGTVVTAGVVHGLRHHHHGPEFYGERFGGEPRPYFKPGVDTPRDVAIRNFEAQMNQDINDMRRGR